MATRTEQPPWWIDSVVYQVYPRSFADSNGDGVGDLRGIIDRLDHLAWLGIDIVWLSPVYRSPMKDGGYDISDHRDVDPLFGTLADLDELIAGVHARGMKLIMDVVLNHTSDQHPWFQASRSSRDDPRRDWYVWRPPRPGFRPGEPGAEPNDWTSFFSEPAWTLDPHTGEYYLHLFAREQPDLNWEQPAVREAMADLLRFWLDRGVDGFRMDVINLVSKPPSFEGVPMSACFSGPRIHEFLRELHDRAFAGRSVRPLTVGEMVDVTPELARGYTDQANREVDMVVHFEHMAVDRGAHKFDIRPLHLPDLKAVMDRWQRGLADVGWQSLYLGNHDQPRLVSRFGDDGRYRVESATLWATVLLLHRGTPFIYQGDEIGMTNTVFAGVDDFRDVEAEGFHRAAMARGEDPETVMAGMRAGARSNARTPMPWDDSPNAGFTTGTPWMPVNPNVAAVNVAAARADPGSVLHHHRRLIALRHALPVLSRGDFTMLLPDHQSIYAYTRRLGPEAVLVLGNVGEAEVEVPIAGWEDAELLLGNLAAPVLPMAPLRPWEARVLRRSPAPRLPGPPA